jgi:hypothetical protein
MTPVIVSVALSAPLLLYICSAFFYFQRILTRAETAITIVVQMVMFWLSLVVFYDQQNWAAQTEAEKTSASLYGSSQFNGHQADYNWWGVLVGYHVCRCSILYAQLFVLCKYDTVDLYKANDELNLSNKLYALGLYAIFIILDLIIYFTANPANQDLISYGNAGHSFKINGGTLCFVSIVCLIMLCILSELMYCFISKQSDNTFPITGPSKHSSMDNDMLQRVRLLVRP